MAKASKTKPKSKTKTKTVRRTASPRQDVLDDRFVPQKAQEILARKNFDGTVAIMHLENDEHFFTIDGIAADAWKLIDGKSTLSKIRAQLVKKHKPPLDRITKDLKILIKTLQKEKLLQK
jgi:hypothetical protein